MKINSNIPIFAILTIFIASNTLLYKHLNNDYFIDKKATTKDKKIENVIFTLIEAHEDSLKKQNAEILLEAQKLRNMKATITDSAELKLIEEKLKALEKDARAVQEQVNSSENEKRVALRQTENNQIQITELLESNNQIGAELDALNEEFNIYVNTIKETLVKNSFSDEDISNINSEFKKKRGLYYINNLIGNIQKNKKELSDNFTIRLKELSNSYHLGLKDIAEKLDDPEYKATLNNAGILEPADSLEKLQTTIINYINARDNEMKEKEMELLKDLKKQLALLSEKDKLKLEKSLEELSEKNNRNLEKSLEELSKKHDIELEKEIEKARIDKEKSLRDLEKKLRDELPTQKTKQIEKIIEVEKVIEVDKIKPDKPIYTNWIHIPGLWTTTPTTISYSGKRVNTIVWSKEIIEDNSSLSFSGLFKNTGECLIIIYGNGRFKSWKDGIIISMISLEKNKALLSITKNGIGENAEDIYTNTISVNTGINGEYNLNITNGKLTMYLNNVELLADFPIKINLSGRIGFANREVNSNDFTISNIKLFKVK